jgi:Zinc dependent phospholipase C
VAVIAAAAACLLVILATPSLAFAWGPITHVALGVQVLATVITPDHPLQAMLLNLPEVFLYGSLAPDIVQGRRLQSRLRHHSHNWSTGLALLKVARGADEKAFALGYLAHLAGDVVAHNFYLPARFIGRFQSRIASHIYAEARFDSLQDRDYAEMLVTLMDSDFSRLDAMLDRAIDSPLVPFRAHRRMFEGGIKRIRQWDAIIRALTAAERNEHADQELFSDTSCAAIAGVLNDPRHASACRFDPMGTEALASALASRRNLQRLTRLGRTARAAARNLASTMVRDLDAHLRSGPFGPGIGTRQS